MNEGTCRHFNGTQNKCCKAGINYSDAFSAGSEFGLMLRMPCFQFNVRPAHGRGTYIKPGEATVTTPFERRGETEIPCALLSLPTHEECEADRVKSDAHFEKAMIAIRVASAWRVKPKPAADRREVIECPVCKGRLHLSQSAYNGHVHGACETDGCVRWME